ncbi:MAG: diaminopimelate decarboxylase [Candidatus Aenigmarchaeota archaeon]|nr:diaminopimelate decarboxylase [Candidatus Aenigmarchaeota archaeon]
MWWEVPGHLEVKSGKLHIAGWDAENLAHSYGTPLHVYNGNRVRDNYRMFYEVQKKYNPMREVRIHYAMKTNSNPGILELLLKESSWIDAVSPGEVDLANDIGYDPGKILFTGSSVSDMDMLSVLHKARINIDSPSQPKRLRKVLDSVNIDDYSISLRVDPGIRGAGHVPENITTGCVEIYGERVPTKFGIDRSEIDEVIRWADNHDFKISGLHFHIGSNWRTGEEIDSFLRNLEWVLDKSKKYTKLLGYEFEFIDVGGGPGVRYRGEQEEFPLDDYAKEVAQRIDGSGLWLQAVAFEPGRYVSADVGLLLAEVVDIKKKDGKWVVGVDTGFNHLPRPEVYNSYHHATVCSKADAEPEANIMIAGNVCETGDYLTRNPIARRMPMPEEGDVIAFHTTGAYVNAMEMKNYNKRLPAPELLIHNGHHSYYSERIERKTHVFF